MILISQDNLRIVEEHMLPELHAVFYSDATQDALETIAQRHSVDDFELSALVGYVLLGILPLIHLTDELQESCNISQEQALMIVVDVRAYVLAPVARELASIQEIAKKNYNTYKK